jgi:hypothetical protein
MEHMFGVSFTHLLGLLSELTVKLLLSSMLLLIYGVTAISCIPAIAGFSAIAGVPLFPDVLTVAGLHCIVDVPCVLRFYVVACVPAVVGVFAIVSARVDPGFPNLAVLYSEAFWTSGLSDCNFFSYRTIGI